MNTVSSHILIPAPVKTVRRILTEPTALAEWNPAFLSVRGPAAAAVGRRYALTAKGGLRGHFEYRGISDTLIDCYWEVPGLSETSTWRLLPHDQGSHVTHTFTHQGTLAALLRPAFAGAADLRLQRLARRAQQRTQQRTRQRTRQRVS
jgi:hypothetical protein